MEPKAEKSRITRIRKKKENVTVHDKKGKEKNKPLMPANRR